ncbi:MAG: cytochrome b [Pseudomonadota bacterium]
MRINNSDDYFGIVSASLHWSNALLILFLFGLGAYMTELSYMHPNYTFSYTVHKSLGILVFELGVLQILWAWISHRPAHLAAHRWWEKLAATIVHRIFFFMIVLIPLSGYAISSAEGKGVEFFDWYAIPALLPQIENQADIAGKIHYYLAYGTLALVLLHITAALKHQFIERDGTISRMLCIRVPNPKQ